MVYLQRLDLIVESETCIVSPNAIMYATKNE